MRFFRSLARPLSLAALLALVAPTWAECRPIGRATAHAGMACCVKTEAQQGVLDSGCCKVRQEPRSQQTPVTNVAAQTTSVPVDASAEAVVPLIAATAPALRELAIESGPPGPPLYLRLSVIRR